MNDRYLFRGKRVDNGEWIFGSLLCGDGYCEIAVRHEDDPLMTRHEVDPATVGQYTTLTDKNGERIWENQFVIDVGEDIWQVRWIDGAWWFCNPDDAGNRNTYDWLNDVGEWQSGYTVVHDTPVEDNKTESNE